MDFTVGLLDMQCFLETSHQYTLGKQRFNRKELVKLIGLGCYWIVATIFWAVCMSQPFCGFGLGAWGWILYILAGGHTIKDGTNLRGTNSGPQILGFSSCKNYEFFFAESFFFLMVILICVYMY